MPDTQGLGYIQRDMLVWFHSKGDQRVTVADYCEHVGCRASRSSAGSVSESQKYYKAARMLRKRGLITSRREHGKNWIELTVDGHSAAYRIREDGGQNRLPL